jgi:hypothetical protein
MNNPFSYFILVSLLITTLACSKKGGTATPDPIIADTTKPNIAVAKPTAGQVFSAGNAIAFQATFSDNDKLKSYDISISKALTGGIFLKVVPTSVPYSYTKSATSLAGKSQDISLNDITIPANTATTIVTPGKYNFKITCVDGSDNSSSTTIEININ